MDAKCDQIKDFITTERPNYPHPNQGAFLPRLKEFLITTMQIDQKVADHYVYQHHLASPHYNIESICSILFDKKKYEKLVEWMNDPLMQERVSFENFLMISELKDIKKLLSDKRQLERELEGSKIMLKSLTSKFKKSRAKSINKNKKSLKKSKKSMKRKH